MVFDELRRIGLSVLQPAHVLDAIEKDQLAALVEPDRVAGLIALLRGAELVGRSLVVQVARKSRGAQAKLPALIDPHFHRRCDGRIRGHQLAHGGGIGGAAAMGGDEAKLGRAVEIAQGNAEGMKAGEQFGRQSGATAQHRARRGEAQKVPDSAQHQQVGERGREVSREGAGA